MTRILTSLPNDWKLLFDERQLKEIEFAHLYAQKFNHGTVGHNLLLLIDKLACWLDRYSDPVLLDVTEAHE